MAAGIRIVSIIPRMAVSHIREFRDMWRITMHTPKSRERDSGWAKRFLEGIHW